MTPLPRLKILTDPTVTRAALQYQLAYIFDRFLDLVPKDRLPFIYQSTNCDVWSVALANFLKNQDALPRELIQALLEIEALTGPEYDEYYSRKYPPNRYAPECPVPSRLKCAIGGVRP